MRNRVIAIMVLLGSAAAFSTGNTFAAEAPVCKVRSMGGGTLGMTFTFWKKVRARTLEECQARAFALLGKTQVWDDVTDPGAPYGYYRPWKAWYKWVEDGITTKGSFRADDIFSWERE